MNIRLIISVLFVAALVTVTLGGGTRLYDDHLELRGPEIKLLEAPRGIGLTPVSFKFHIKDDGAGLRALQVVLRSRGASKELLSKQLDRVPSDIVRIDFAGERSLEPGVAQLELHAVDASLWGNSSSLTVPIRVDYQRPQIEVVSAPTVAREGSSELTVYRVIDEDPAFAGVKLGNITFPGFPARGLDSALSETSLQVALYALPLGSHEENVTVRVFAEDRVGNASALPIEIKLLPRTERTVRVALSDAYLRGPIAEIAEANLAKPEIVLARGGQQVEFVAAQGSKERLLEMFSFVEGPLREVNRAELLARLQGPRFERYWEQPFLRPTGNPIWSFGDNVRFEHQGEEILTHRSDGMLLQLPPTNREVFAANDGIVAFTENLGAYGRLIAIDHGLGVVSIYSGLEATTALRGEKVSRGSTVGYASRSGLGLLPQYGFELRVHGVPTDPIPWMSTAWLESNVQAQIDQAKRALNLPVYRPLR